MNTERDHLGQEEQQEEKPITDVIDSDATESEESVDYSQYGKEDLVKLAEGLLKEEDIRKADGLLRQIKPVFDEIREHEREEALHKFTADGGEETDFEFKADELATRFDQAYRQFKEKKSRQLQDSEKAKERNLQAKMLLLDRLRQLTDAEETNVSIAELKQLQQEWKTIGPVPAAQNKSLWASYNALIELFYSNRSIYFELKELDRRKNLSLKQEICDKAEKLAEQEPSSTVIKELHDLHEEYKHIGPVPKEEQEALWQRFKAASDAVYAKRREQQDSVRKDLDQNLEAKNQLCTIAESFAAFESDKITDWNDKTREILDLQKQWEAVGIVPRERAKEVNKRFWSAFKSFFHHKNEFFKRLENFREENLRKKTELCAQVEALKDSEDLESTAEQIKQLQQSWKDIGPVPEKQRNQVYDRFKAACDQFFDRRRAQRSNVERDYEANLKKKEELCARIEALAENDPTNQEEFENLRSEYQTVGFVPRKNMHAIQKRYMDAIQKFVSSNPKLSDQDKARITLSEEVSTFKNNPKANKILQRKEHGMRKRLSQLENDIAVWKNNMEFFANSKTADKLKQEFEKKIQAAEEEYSTLKRQLQLMHQL